MQGGYGAKLLKSPDLIRDMVRQARARTDDLPVSIKIRIDTDLRYRFGPSAPPLCDRCAGGSKGRAMRQTMWPPAGADRDRT